MPGASGGEQSEIHQHSGWLIPFGLALVILVLCGAVLLYDLRPAALFRNNAPSADVRSVSLSVRGVQFQIPGNYLEARASRRGDDPDLISLSALLPDMRGYSAQDAGSFLSNPADSPVVHLVLRADTNSLSAADRLARIYRPYFAGSDGTPDQFGLTRYTFRDGTGYERNDLYAGGGGAGPLLLLCERPAQDLPSPNCLAIDRPVAPGVNLSYRFKRSQLSHWREIATGVDMLVAKFMKRQIGAE
jgi:hypothetical protein